jgi:hypothetical protein
MFAESLGGLGGLIGAFEASGEVKPSLGMVGFEANDFAIGLGCLFGLVLLVLNETQKKPSIGLVAVDRQTAGEGFRGSGGVAELAVDIREQVEALGIGGGEESQATQGLLGILEASGTDMVGGEQEPGDAIIGILFGGIDEGLIFFRGSEGRILSSRDSGA